MMNIKEIPPLSGVLFGVLFGLSIASSIACAAPSSTDPVAHEQAAARVSAAFLHELSEAMASSLSAGGPPAAITVCADLAPEIANRLSRENGWRVTRVGTRVRNPLLGMPDAWEQQVLASFAARIAQGEAVAGMSHGEVTSETDGQYFRFMKAIPVQSSCLLCHGPAQSLPESITSLLKTHYPFDRAIGYAAGELRGAVSIKQPLDKPER